MIIDWSSIDRLIFRSSVSSIVQALSLVACKRALRMGYSEICFRIARGRARERRAPPSYSKANLGITHTESLLAGYVISDFICYCYHLHIILDNSLFFMLHILIICVTYTVLYIAHAGLFSLHFLTMPHRLILYLNAANRKLGIKE